MCDHFLFFGPLSTSRAANLRLAFNCYDCQLSWWRGAPPGSSHCCPGCLLLLLLLLWVLQEVRGGGRARGRGWGAVQCCAGGSVKSLRILIVLLDNAGTITLSQ